MNIPSLRILRPAWLPWLALVYTFFFTSIFLFGLLWSQINEAPGELVGRAAFHAGLLTQLFIFVALVLPLGIGVTLAQAFHEPFHCPFGMLVPSARRRLVVGHIGLTVTLAAAVAIAAHFVKAGIPLIASLGVGMGAMSLSVPLEPGMRWQGSRLAFFALCGLLVLSSFGVWRLPALMVSNEFIVGAAGFGIAVLCFGLGYSRERLRARAMTPGTTFFGALGDGAALGRWKKQFQATMQWSFVNRTGSDLPFAATDGSTWSWLRLVQRERYGQGRIPQHILFLLMPVVILLVFLGFGYFHPMIEPRRGLAIAMRRDLDPWIMGSIIMGAYSMFCWPKIFYPFSRSDRFRVVAAWSVKLELMLLVTVLLAVCGQEWGEMLAGSDRAGVMLPTIGVGSFLALGLIPLLLFAGLCRSRRQTGRSIALLALSCGILVTGLGTAQFRFLFSSFGLIIAAVLIIILHVSYFAGLRYVCLKADLVSRSA